MLMSLTVKRRRRMWLSRGWRRLLVFWVGAVALVGIGVGTLQMLGPSGPKESAAQERHADPTAVQNASLVTVPVVFATVEPAPDRIIEPPGDVAEVSPPRAEQ